ncbi:MAG: efflux transporter outer membrane subunit [Pirellulaceae bacterium]
MRQTRPPRRFRLHADPGGLRISPAGSWSLLAALTMLFVGCATGPAEWVRNGFRVGPNYARPPAPVSENWLDADEPHVLSQATDYSDWWAVFDDPVLDHLIGTAYEQNLPLKIAGMRVLEARSRLGVASGNLFPQRQESMGGFANSKFSETSFPFGEIPLTKTVFDTWFLGYDAAWELDFWGRFRLGIESAEANLSAQIENYDDALVILQAEVAATYVQVRTLEARIALARKNVELQQHTYRIIRDRVDVGAGEELDLQQARSTLVTTKSLVPTLQTNQRKAQNRLCILLGMPPHDLQTELGGPGKVPSAPPEIAVGIPAELLRRRPDVCRAEREAAAQCAQIGIAESELYPQISISGAALVEAENFSRLFDVRSIAGFLGPNFRWNIFNYGRIRNNVDVQDARFQQLVLQYQETVLRAHEEVENGINAYLREQERIVLLKESVEATARALELATLKYDQGLVDFQRVIDSQRLLVQQQDALARTRGDVALHLIAVFKALGGGWQIRGQHPPVE